MQKLSRAEVSQLVSPRSGGRVVAGTLAALVMAAACSGGSGKGDGGISGIDAGDPCKPDPCAGLAGSRCMAGRCVTGAVKLGGIDAAATVSGTYTSFADGTALVFSAALDSLGGATASFQLAGSADKVTVKLTSANVAEMTVGGQVITGKGAIGATAQAQLTALSASPLARMMALAVLELGCHSDGVDPLQLAALVFPWQVLLKYAVTDRVAAVQALAAQSSCAYFQEPMVSSDAPIPALLGLALDDPVPNVFGYFPLDEPGALETPASAARIMLSGAPNGPCGALCRGACGPDCTLNNCQMKGVGQCVLAAGKNTGDWQVGLTYTCGTHQACRDHDDCYDLCNQNRCDSWGAACCRRACDSETAATYPTQAPYWARGYGTFDGTLDFTYWDPPRYEPGFCPVSGASNDGAAPDTRDSAGLPDRAPDVAVTPEVAKADIPYDLPVDPVTPDLTVINTWRRGAFELAFQADTDGCSTLDTQSDGLVKVTSTCQIDKDGQPFTQTDTFQWAPPPAQLTIPEIGSSYDAVWWNGTINVSSVISTTNIFQPPNACVDHQAWQTTHPADTYATRASAVPCSRTQPAAVIPIQAREGGVFHPDPHAGNPPPSDSPVVFELNGSISGAGSAYYLFYARYTYTK